MIRYLRLYAYFVRFSFMRAMEFRIDFYFRILMDFIFYAVNIFFYKIIFLHTPTVGGWNENQVMIFIGGYLVIDAIHMTVFANNVWWLPILVNKGDLDYYLVRPVSSLFFLSLRDFAANSFINLICAIAILAWAILQYPEPFSVWQILAFTLYLLIGTLLFFFVYLITVIPVFWTHARGFMDLFHTISRLVERPDQIFRGPVRWVLTILVPFSVMGSFPARLFMEGFQWGTFLHLCGITVAFFFLCVGFWNLGLRNYSSASS